MSLETCVDRLGDDVVNFLRGRDFANSTGTWEPWKENTGWSRGRLERVIEIAQTSCCCCIVSKFHWGQTSKIGLKGNLNALCMSREQETETGLQTLGNSSKGQIVPETSQHSIA